jgi:glycosyltransferase involved in cell wall biosynthesis
MQQISLAITTHNRADIILESFVGVIDDERIGEVCIVDDCSDEYDYSKLCMLTSFYPKVKVYRNAENKGVYYNKKRAVELSQFPYLILLDSDNSIDTSFLDKIYSKEWYADTIFAPDFAAPVFDYTYFSGNTFTKSNVAPFVFDRGFDCLINTMNYFVNREKYLEVFEDGIEPIGSDSIHQNYNWLKAGYRIHVLKGLTYQHRVWEGSHYVANATASTPLCKILIDKLAQLK